MVIMNDASTEERMDLFPFHFWRPRVSITFKGTLEFTLTKTNYQQISSEKNEEEIFRLT